MARLHVSIRAKRQELAAHASLVIRGQTGATATTIDNALPTLQAHQRREQQLAQEAEEERQQLVALMAGGPLYTGPIAPRPTQQPTQPTQQVMIQGTEDTAAQADAELQTHDAEAAVAAEAAYDAADKEEDADDTDEDWSGLEEGSD